MNIYLFWEVRTSKITTLKNENRQNGSIRIKIQKKSTLRKKYKKQIHKKETIIGNINQIKSSNRFYIYI